MKTTENQEYNDFIAEATQKVSELQLKYNRLSENNKKRFAEHIMPMFRTLETQDLFNQMYKLFNAGIK